MKPVVVLIVALAVAGGIWWYSGAQESVEIVVDGNVSGAEPGSSVPNPLEVVNENVESAESAESAESGDDTGAGSETDSLDTAESDTAEPDTDSGSSPFALVESPAKVEEPTVVNPQTQAVQQQPVAQTNEVDEGGSQRSLLEPVVVPSSYPVTDAAKYFIPKEERGPGRLGGPPPLDFPGGPSDPNRDTNSLLQPPPAPGQ
ncbi:MAG: hypothetical protein AB8B87_01700 [Granulosicoccus sp.]